MRLTTYVDRPARFWAALGPFFASRAVRRELPYLSDEPGAAWIVATEGSAVIGFAAAKLNGTAGLIHGLYVTPEHREQGVAAELVGAALTHLRALGAATVCTTANVNSVAVFRRHGFLDVRSKGGYQIMEAALGPAE